MQLCCPGALGLSERNNQEKTQQQWPQKDLQTVQGKTIHLVFDSIYTKLLLLVSVFLMPMLLFLHVKSFLSHVLVKTCLRPSVRSP